MYSVLHGLERCFKRQPETRLSVFRLPWGYAASVQRRVSPAHIGTTRASPKAKLSGTRCSRFSSVMVRVFSGSP